MRAVEPTLRAGRRRPGELLDQVEPTEAGRDPQVARLEAEQVDDLPVAPEERCHERRAAVAARRQVGARAGVEQQPRELPVIRVARLVELRPAVVVAAVYVGTALEEEPDDLEVAPAIPSRSFPFVPRSWTSSACRSSSSRTRPRSSASTAR